MVKKGFTPLQLAVLRANYIVVKLLLEAGVDFLKGTKACSNIVSFADDLLKRNPASVERQDIAKAISKHAEAVKA
jgi:hypothetical protein